VETPDGLLKKGSLCQDKQKSLEFQDQTNWPVFRMIHEARIRNPKNAQSLVFGLTGKARWWFQIVFIFTPKIGEDSHFD